MNSSKSSDFKVFSKINTLKSDGVGYFTIQKTQLLFCGGNVLERNGKGDTKG